MQLRFPHCWLLLLLMLSVAACNTAAQPQTAPIPKKNVLPAEDARLQRPVTLNETGISLKALLRKLSDKTLSLTCDADCSAQKLQIYLKQRPLRKLMSALAELLPGTWEPLEQKHGYKLIMSARAVKDRAYWWQLFLGGREKALTAQSANVLAAMRTTPEEAQVQGDQPNGNGLTQADQQTFFHSLPDSLQGQIAAQINDTPFYGSRQTFTANDDEGAILFGIDNLPAAAQQIIRKEFANLPAGSTVQFTNGGFTVWANVIGPDGKMLGYTLSIDVRNTWPTDALSLNQTRLAGDISRLGQNAPAEWQQMEEYQQRTFWKNAPSHDNSPQRYPPPNRADVLQWLADKGKIEFVADYYSRPGITLPGEMQPPLTRPLEEELNYRAAEFDMSWKRQESLYLFRDNRWYRDDNLEVPAPLAERWIKIRTDWESKFDPSGPRPQRTLKERLDWEATFVTQLSRWQIANGLMWLRPEKSQDVAHEKEAASAPPPASPFAAFPFYQDADSTTHEYHLAQFYAGLDDAARTALAENRLQFSMLSPPQQEQALFLAPSLRAALQAKNQASVLLGLEMQGLIDAKPRLIFTVSASP